MNKFTVFKNEDIEKYLSPSSKYRLGMIEQAIQIGRRSDDKANDNRYAIINLDEPYANQVTDIMRANGHWEDDI